MPASSGRLSKVSFAFVAVVSSWEANVSISCFACSPASESGGSSSLKSFTSSSVASMISRTSASIAASVPAPGD